MLVIVRLTGGLGNQLFMYAFGRSVAAARKEKVKFFFQRSSWDYALEPFHLPIEFQKPEWNVVFDELSFAFDSGVFSKDIRSAYEDLGKAYFRGYWQSEKYFNVDLIRNDFKHWLTFPLKAELPKNYVSIHVRRGDYLKKGTKEIHGVLPEEYYQAAIDYMKSRIPTPVFVVYTDDPDMKEFMGYSVASSSNQHLDLWTLTGFSNAILANSSFSWWGAWLGQAATVVAPKQWFADTTIDTKDLIPDRWVRL
jgi:Glycosyl transferase family 11